MKHLLRITCPHCYRRVADVYQDENHHIEFHWTRRAPTGEGLDDYRLQDDSVGPIVDPWSNSPGATASITVDCFNRHGPEGVSWRISRRDLTKYLSEARWAKKPIDFPHGAYLVVDEALRDDHTEA